MRLLSVLLVFLPQANADDKAAEELFKAMRDKIDHARTLRAESSMTMGQAGLTFEVALSFKVKGSDHWTLNFEMLGQGAQVEQFPKFSALYDGRKLVARGKMEWANAEDFKPERMAAELRQNLSSAAATRGFFGMQWGGGKASTMSPVKDGGKERVGDREVRIVEFIVENHPDASGKAMNVRMFVDPATKLPIKREFTSSGFTWTETYRTLALDEDIPDSEFSIQSKRTLARTQGAQLATSVRLFGLYTGRHPEKLEDLVRRPAGLEPDVFWPARGFVLGGAIPQDPWGRPFELVVDRGRVSVVSRGADGKPGGKGDDEDSAIDVPAVTRRAVGAPSERLKKYYTARVEVQLLAAAVKAWRDLYGELPKKKAALWEKPEWADVWPEGGWLPGGAVPVDPWGDPYRIISNPTFVRVQVKDPKPLALSAKSLTPEEQKSLDEISRPRLSDDERKTVFRLIDQLGEDDFDVREKAESELQAMGPAIATLLDERLKKEKPGEAALRLAGVRKSIPSRRPAWMSELAPLAITIRAEDPASSGGPADERRAMLSLKTLATAEADFRANDRDGNHVNDFWTGDVAGLYTVVPEGAKDVAENSIKLIELSVALADGAPLNDGAALEKLGEREPKFGYWFRVMQKDASVTPIEEYQQETTGKAGAAKVHHTSRFGFCSYPAEYGVTGKRTYIISENNTIFSRDTGGEPVLEWPNDADLATWKRED
jgi:hypothetical protein